MKFATLKCYQMSGKDGEIQGLKTKTFHHTFAKKVANQRIKLEVSTF